MSTTTITREIQQAPEISGEHRGNAQMDKELTGGIKLEIINQADILQGIKLWSEIEQRLENQRLTCSLIWIKNWLQVYGEQVNYEFGVAKVGQTACGIALITYSHHLKNGYYNIRSIHLGTAGEPNGQSVVIEYNTLLVEEQYRKQFMQQLFHYMTLKGDWDELHFDGFESRELTAISEKHQSVNKVHQSSQVRESRFMNLDKLRSQQQDVFSALGKSTKSNIKRKLKAYGKVKLEWAEQEAEAITIFHELISLHQARWEQQGMPGAFASLHFKQFQLNLLKDLLPQKKVVLFKASTEQGTIGCLMLLVDQGRLLDYLSGFAPFVSGTSPGLLTHYLCMEESLKRNYLAYDFLVGEKRHKENLGKESTTLIWYQVQRITWKFRLQEFLRGLKQKLKKFSCAGNKSRAVIPVHNSNDNESTTYN